MKKKVLLITVRADFGGGPEHVYRLIKNMSSDIEYYIACPKEEPYWEKYKGLLGEERMLEIPHRKFLISYYNEMVKFIKINNINTVHSHGKGAGIYSRLLKISLRKKVNIVHTFHGIHLDYNSIINRLYILIEKSLSNATDSFICVSKGESEKVKSLNLVQFKKVHVIPNGVEIPKEYISLKGNMPKIISVTRFDNQKNSKASIDIMKDLVRKQGFENSTLTFIGEGPQVEELKEYVVESGLGNNVFFFGTSHNVTDEMKKYNLYLSSSKWEGMPLAVLEAMSVGLPCVLSNVVGNKDIVNKNRDGFLYDLNHLEQATNYIVELFNSNWEEISGNARKKIIDSFSIEAQVQKTRNIYNLR